MQRHWSKEQKQELCRLAEIAHNRELGKALEQLENAFKQWRAGGIDAFELNHTIDTYHQGPSREIWGRYARTPPEVAVARAMAWDILQPADVGDELTGELTNLVEMFRDLDAEA